MSNVRKWTNEEDKVLVQLIEENPHNLSKCFLAASVSLNRTPSACTFRWYGVLSNPESPKYVGTSIITMSKNRRARNRKNYYEGCKQSPVRSSRKIWSQILTFFRVK